MKRTTGWIAVGFALAIIPASVSCNRKGDDPVRTVLKQVPSPSGVWTATLDQIAFKSGFTTPDYDRVVLTGAKQADPEGDIAFIEVRMPDADKPTLAWSGDHLVITVAKDASIVAQKKTVGDLQVEIATRK